MPTVFVRDNRGDISMEIKGRSVQLRYADESDANFIYSLRVDPARNKFISEVTGAVEDQRLWLRRYKEREVRGQEHYFIICSGDIPLGTVRIYDIQGDSFCWGSWVIKPGAPKTAAIESAVLVYELAFYHLGFSRTHFDVRVENKRVVAFHQRFGAKIVRSTDRDHFFEYTKEGYGRVRSKYLKFVDGVR